LTQAESVEQPGGFPFKYGWRCIQEFGVDFGRESTQQERVYMDGSEAGGPFETLQTPGDVFGRGGLPTAVAPHEVRSGHRWRKIVVDGKWECKWQ
jgi:hypothetical protein